MNPAPPVNPGAHFRLILVVEDKPTVLEFLCEILQDEGFATQAMESADRAWDFLQEHAADVALLLTDISLPHMSGAELAGIAARDHPQLEVVFSTGHAPANSGVSDPRARFLVKPFTLEQLQQALLAPGPAAG